jgi:hypothetical protein
MKPTDGLLRPHRAEQTAGLQDNARQVLEIAGEAGERGAVIGQLTSELCREIQGAFTDARRFARLGAPAANERSLKLALTRTILGQFRDAGLDVELIAPGLRHLPGELVGNYVNSAVGWATRVLDASTVAA